jgi:hypothetical protein
VLALETAGQVTGERTSGDEAVFVGIGGVEEGVQLVLADGWEHLVQQTPQLLSLDEAAPWRRGWGKTSVKTPPTRIIIRR